ncbi:hypothetical protein [Calderihabitans maritimus]|uniref:hypothetical protein n=1 Tax=Calderihabitans maritimus TaxID=1246530 RepID=UPI001177F37B|nr:hypothetical protein [Calderihabitans maritimus]
MQKKFLLATIFVSLIVILVAGCSSANSTNQSLRQAQSKDEVDQYLATMTPGLKRAEELGLVTALNMDIPVPEANTSVRLEKIWYNSKDVFLFYSLEYRPGVRLYFGSIEPADKGEKAWSGPGFTSNFAPEEGIIYQGRYYGRITFHPLYRDNEILPKVDKIIWNKAKLRIGDDTYELEPVALTVNYDRSREVEISHAVNQTWEILGRKFIVEKLVLGVAENRLKFTFVPQNESERIRWVRGEVFTDKGERNRIDMSVEKGEKPNEYWVVFPAFNELPQKITLSLEQLILVGDDELTFNIESAPYKQYLNFNSPKKIELNQELGRVHQTRVVLEDLVVDDRGIAWGLLFEPENDHLPYEALYADIPHDGSNNAEVQLPNTVYVTNEKGETGTLGQSGSGPGNRMGAFINAGFVKQSELLTVRITHMTFALNGRWILEIELEKE